MKNIQPLLFYIYSILSMLITAGYMLLKIITALERRQAKPAKKTNWQEAKWPAEKAKENPSYAQEVIIPASKTNTVTMPSIGSKSTISTAYPGVKKLLLPIHEKDPYKIYQMTSSRRTHVFKRLLSKYSTTRKAILMAELIQPKN